jgi:hypothetical protein
MLKRRQSLGGRGKGGEMSQTLYAHMDERKKKGGKVLIKVTTVHYIYKPKAI